MWYCKECDEKFEEPGTWNAKNKKFLCANCASQLSEQAVEHRVQATGLWICSNCYRKNSLVVHNCDACGIARN